MRRQPPSRHRRTRLLAALSGALVVGAASLAACTGTTGPVGSPATSSPPPPNPLGLSADWKLVGQDEFDGSALDTRFWQPNRYGDSVADAPFNPDGEDAWFSPANVSVSDGVLNFRVTPDERTLNDVAYPYRSGTVHSAPGEVIRSGNYVEARIEVPICPGCWPAFWAVPQGGQWPPEIDILENFDTSTQVQPTFNYIDKQGGKTGPTPYGQPEVDYRSGYHVYGLLWQGTTLTPYVDGVAYPSVTAKDLPSAGLGLILNLSVARDGQPGADTQMSVDWVRIWSKQP